VRVLSALAYFDGYARSGLPANLLQAQRDFFGAHTYERLDKPRGEFLAHQLDRNGARRLRGRTTRRGGNPKSKIETKRDMSMRKVETGRVRWFARTMAAMGLAGQKYDLEERTFRWWATPVRADPVGGDGV